MSDDYYLRKLRGYEFEEVVPWEGLIEDLESGGEEA